MPFTHLAVRFECWALPCVLFIWCLCYFQGHTPIDLAHQVHSPLLIHMLSVVKTERMKANSSCLKLLNRYKVHSAQIRTDIYIVM